MSKYFGTDGFRGEANKGLTAMHAFRIGEFLGYYFKKKFNNINFVIGKDTRLSGSMLEHAIASGINSTGGMAYLLGVTTTPSVAYLTKSKNFACGIMISASHNPFYDNGIKLINSNGEKMDEEVINQIEEYLDGNIQIEYAYRDSIGETIEYSLGVKEYINHLIDLGPDLSGMRIGLDLANGSASAVAREVFEGLGANIFVINEEPTGLNINNNCGSTHMESLKALLNKYKLDIGFSFDGDCDRCLGATKDVVLTGDHILYIYANYLKENNRLVNNTVVTTVMSNFGLYKALDEKNISYAKTKVGDKYVYEYMKENNCVIGGEQSGHIIFINDASTGDGILTALKMLEVLVNTNKKIDELIEGLTIYPQVLINVKVTDKKEVLNDNDVVNQVKEVEEDLSTSGRILVRESGTEPLIRVMVEAETIDICTSLANKVVDVIKSKGYVID